MSAEKDRAFVSATAALASCATSLVLYFTPLRGHISASLSPLAVVWAMFAAFPHLSATLDFSKRSVFAGLVGGVAACVLGLVGNSWRFGVLVISFPFPLLFAFCDQSCRMPWERLIFFPAAMVVFYGSLAFGPSSAVDMYKFAGEMVSYLALGGGCATSAHLFLSLLLRRRASFCVSDVERLLRSCLQKLLYSVEGSMAYLTTGSIHCEELQFRLQTLQGEVTAYQAAVAVWVLEPWSDKPSTESLAAVEALLVTAYAQQSALLKTMGDGYSPEGKKDLWEGVAVELESLRLCTIAALRLMCQWSCDSDIKEQAVAGAVLGAEHAAESFREAVESHRTITGMQGGFQIKDPDEVLRALFAQLVLKNFPSLVGELFRAIRAIDVFERAKMWRADICRNSVTAVYDLGKMLCTGQEYFKMSPADEILDEGRMPPVRKRARRVAKFPLRITLCAHATTLLLIGLGRDLPSIVDYSFWALLPCILCFLPTTGAVMLKSLRRALGTVLGGIASFGSLSFSPGNEASFLMQCFIITFIAKYASTNKRIDYGGLTLGLTWHVVVWSTWKSTEDGDRREPLAIALWRIGMTLAGTILAVIGSLVLFPTHATSEFERRTAETMLCTTEVCVLSTLDMLSHGGDDLLETASLQSLGSEPMAIAPKATPVVDLVSSVRASMGERLALLTEGEAERWVVARKVENVNALHDASAALLNTAIALNGCSVVATDEDKEASRYFLSDATRHGPSLKRNLLQVHEGLRAATLGLALQLQGVRAPHSSLGRHQLHRSLNALQRNFSLTRREVLQNGAMASLVRRGLDRFYAQVYGLVRYADEWLSLEEELLGALPTGTEDEEQNDGQASDDPGEDSQQHEGDLQRSEGPRNLAARLFGRSTSLWRMSFPLDIDEDTEASQPTVPHGPTEASQPEVDDSTGEAIQLQLNETPVVQPMAPHLDQVGGSALRL